MAYWISKEVKTLRTTSKAARSGMDAYEHKLLHDAEHVKKEAEEHKTTVKDAMLDFILGRVHLRDTFTDKH